MSLSFYDLHNMFRGGTCVIAGNGKTLSDVPLEFLKQNFTFGTNRVYLLDGFTPDFYVSVNKNVVKQFHNDINTKIMRSLKFIHKDLYKLVDGAYPLVSSAHTDFSYDPVAYINEGYTVTYVCLQLAYYFGFTTVLLVGVDHQYKYSGKPNELCKVVGRDENHFHPDYFSDGVLWNNPDLDKSEMYYKVAKDVYEQDGRRIINLTNGTKLDIFDKDTIDNWSL